MIITQAIGIATIVGIVILIAICTWRMVKFPKDRLYLIAPLSWGVYSFVLFGLSRLDVLISDELGMLLGALWALHTVTLVLGGLLIFVWKPKPKNKQGGEHGT